jgi:hypothetical protein
LQSKEHALQIHVADIPKRVSVKQSLNFNKMKIEKMSLQGMKKLSREEQKKITAGSDGNPCVGFNERCSDVTETPCCSPWACSQTSSQLYGYCG